MNSFNKKILVFCFSVALNINSNSQNFEKSGDCQDSKNVNCNDSQTSYMNKDNIRAVFRYSNPSGGCTGSMINQFYDAGGVLKQLFISADHCYKESDLDLDWSFDFNYQSPNCSNSSVPNTNVWSNGNLINARGIQSLDNWNSFVDWKTYPTNLYTISQPRYSFTSRVRRVANNGWVDGALFEILTPIPPHFNVYYAGWDVTYNPFGIGLPKYVIHHPRGDIKKVAYTFTTLEIALNPVCHTITVVVDAVLNFFFGWITTFRTETVCTYTENPRILVPFFTSGVVEHGSSGASLFTTSNRITGVLNGSISTCDVRATLGEWFGRLHSFWNASGSVRQALDRRKKTYLEQAFGFVTGMDGQQPSCYTGEPLALNGNYFPAKDYQPENKITINAAQRALLASGSGHNGGNLRAFAGSDFVINAPDIEIGNGDFDIDANATFELNNQSCSPANARMEAQDALAGCNLARMEFDPEFAATEVDDNVNYNLSLSPNPASKEIEVEFNLNAIEAVKIEILNTTGIIVKNNTLENTQIGTQTIAIITTDLISGTYFLKFTTENYTQTLKFIILK